MRKIGVIVGTGKLPLYFLQEREKNDLDVFPIGLFDTIDEEIKNIDNFKMFNIGQVGDVVKYLLKNNVKEIIMLGKVEKQIIFRDLQLDKYGEELLKKLPDRKDETLLFGIISFLRLNGIKVLPQNKFIKECMFKNKCYTKVLPNDMDNKTIRIGIEAAKALSKVDAGQCVVCKDMSVVALEGIEGTNKCIKRGGQLAGANTIIVKMSRPQQNMKVDIPVIGIDTIKEAININARGVVGEAGKMIFLNESNCIELAEKNNMFIIGI
ncbi:MAG: UDP-2,3-diacylglucosamine diphosphatase LpxI [Fusobacteriaceae bacterium]|jgi:DUF1009 family protein|nr:UDP-2,3-diacylglucosamine diphosphatase LpxI [Fusobacteriaceae bacterium]